MGWGYCGKNSETGDEMGYSVQGVCSCSGCNKEIDHGLAFVCGGMHEGGDLGCGRYFCYDHLFPTYFLINEKEDEVVDSWMAANKYGCDRQLCKQCQQSLLECLREEYGTDNVEFA